jgi:hypothetical protein
MQRERDDEPGKSHHDGAGQCYRRHGNARRFAARRLLNRESAVRIRATPGNEFAALTLPSNRLGLSVALKLVTVEPGDANLPLTAPVRKQAHGHLMLDDAPLLVDVIRSRISEIAYPGRDIFVGCAPIHVAAGKRGDDLSA